MRQNEHKNTCVTWLYTVHLVITNFWSQITVQDYSSTAAWVTALQQGLHHYNRGLQDLSLLFSLHILEIHLVHWALSPLSALEHHWIQAVLEILALPAGPGVPTNLKQRVFQRICVMAISLNTGVLKRGAHLCNHHTQAVQGFHWGPECPGAQGILGHLENLFFPQDL